MNDFALPSADEVGNPLLSDGGHSQQPQAAGGASPRNPGVKKKGQSVHIRLYLQLYLTLTLFIYIFLVCLCVL